MHGIEKPRGAGLLGEIAPCRSWSASRASHFSFWRGRLAGGRGIAGRLERVLVGSTPSSFSAEQATSSIISVLSAGRTGAVQGGGGEEEGRRRRRRGERRERRREAERGNDLQFRMGRQAVRIMDFHSLPSFSSSSPLHPPLPPSLLLLLPPLPPSFPSPSLQVNDRGRQVLKRHLLSPESYPILSIHPSIHPLFAFTQR